MITVIILTKNEEADLPYCLESVKWCDDVHVLDSGSTDKTFGIVQKYCVNWITNPFESFGQQRNFALDNINIKNEWILFLDADEVVSENFREAVIKATSNAFDSVAGFYCCWKMMLEGKWLKHCDNFPKWQFRLMRKNRARFMDFGHSQKESSVKGVILYITEPYIHNGFSKGWVYWIERHNRYSTQEAIARLKFRPPLRNVLDRHASIRNVALKSWLSIVPGWPILRFIQAYFLNLGFMEGQQGFIYCINMAYYEFLIQLKMRELKQSQMLRN